MKRNETFAAKIRLIKMLRHFTGCSLKQGRDFAQSYPHLVRAEMRRKDHASDPAFEHWSKVIQWSDPDAEPSA